MALPSCGIKSLCYRTGHLPPPPRSFRPRESCRSHHGWPPGPGSPPPDRPDPPSSLDPQYGPITGESRSPRSIMLSLRVLLQIYWKQKRIREKLTYSQWYRVLRAMISCVGNWLGARLWLSIFLCLTVLTFQSWSGENEFLWNYRWRVFQNWDVRSADGNLQNGSQLRQRAFYTRLQRRHHSKCLGSNHQRRFGNFGRLVPRGCEFFEIWPTRNYHEKVSRIHSTLCLVQVYNTIAHPVKEAKKRGLKLDSKVLDISRVDVSWSVSLPPRQKMSHLSAERLMDSRCYFCRHFRAKLTSSSCAFTGVHQIAREIWAITWPSRGIDADERTSKTYVCNQHAVSSGQRVNVFLAFHRS